MCVAVPCHTAATTQPPAAETYDSESSVESERWLIKSTPVHLKASRIETHTHRYIHQWRELPQNEIGGSIEGASEARGLRTHSSPSSTSRKATKAHCHTGLPYTCRVIDRLAIAADRRPMLSASFICMAGNQVLV